jgi:DNA mismatch endonuclease, patch repair protein
MRRIKSVSKVEVAAARFCGAKAGCRLAHQLAGILGRPDYANKKRKVAVFFHGCFFHGHHCKDCSVKTNRAFWVDKVAHNQARHSYVELMLEAAGWTVLTVWECEFKAENRRAAATVGEPGGRSAARRPRRI